MTTGNDTPQPKLLPVDEDWERAVAVVAHPDDLEYGVASAIARWTSQGKKITYLLATRGEAGIDSMSPAQVGPIREEEERRSAAVVGVDTVEFLDYMDGVVLYSLQLRKDIARVFRRHRPDIVITINHHLTFGRDRFNMADHREVGLATLDAARDAGNRWIFPELLAEQAAPWTGIRRVLIAASPEPTHAVDVTGYLDRGIASLKEHRQYIENLSQDFDPEEFLTWNAAAAGEQFGTDYAVTFQVMEL